MSNYLSSILNYLYFLVFQLKACENTSILYFLAGIISDGILGWKEKIN